MTSNAAELAMTVLILAILISVIDASTRGRTGSKNPILTGSGSKNPLLTGNAMPSLFASTKNRIRHVRGKYKYKEEVIKKIEHDHPCKLTQTAVKITFPGMKEQVLVSFLGK